MRKEGKLCLNISTNTVFLKIKEKKTIKHMPKIF